VKVKLFNGGTKKASRMNAVNLNTGVSTQPTIDNRRPYSGS